MAIKTSHLLGLLTLGFIILLIGWPWWLGIGIILLSMAVAVSGESEEPAPMPVPVERAGQAAVAGVAQPGSQQAAQAEPKYFDDWGEDQPNWTFPDISKDLKFKISTPSDAIGDMKTMKDPYHDGVDHIGAVGARTGTFTLDPNNIIRFKDDFRIKIDQMSKESGVSDEGQMGWEKGAYTFRLYYRTSPKRAWPRRTALQWKAPPPGYKPKRVEYASYD